MNTESRPTSSEERRLHLLARSARLRERIAQDGHALLPTLHMADKAEDLATRLREQARQHAPLLVLAGAALAATALTRPRLLLGTGLHVWTGWQTLRRIRPLAQVLMQGLAHIRARRW